jgi:PAS domain S-box-containing protein
MDTDHLTLSDREREIVLLAAEGLADKEIAKRLGITAGTVRTYWERLRPKLGASNRAQAAAMLLVMLYQDSERQRQTECENSKLIIDNVRDFAIFSIDLDHRITSWNPGVERLFGYTEPEWLKLHADEIFSPEDRASGVPEREMETSRKAGRADDDTWLVRKDGTRFYVNGIMVALRSDDGVIHGYAKIVRDRMEHLARDQKIAALEEELAKLRGS